jgi:phage terminase large subunit
LLHVFSQEVDRDYLAAVQGIMIKPQWLKSCIDAHIKLGFEPCGITQAGVDASDEGGDIDAITIRKGSVVIHNENWNCAGDHDFSAGKANEVAMKQGADELVYDSIGVGAGFKTAMKHIEGINYEVDGWNAGGGVIDPDERVYKDDGINEDKRTNKDFFLNAKAQAWWEIRERARKTHTAITTGKHYHPDELLSLCSESLGHDRIEHMIGELASPKMQYSNGKVKVESKAEMKKRELDSPNDADSLVMSFAKVDKPDYSLDSW